MKVFMILISIALIAIVLLQSNKAEDASQLLSGEADLFSQRKERGTELFISRLTLALGIIFFAVSLIMEFM